MNDNSDDDATMRDRVHMTGVRAALLPVVVAAAAALPAPACSGNDTPAPRCSSLDSACGGTDLCLAACLCRSGDRTGCLETCPGETGLPGEPGELGTSRLMRDRLLALVNDSRARGACCGGRCAGPAGPLGTAPALEIAAQLHAEDMRARQFFAHTSPDGLSPVDRARLVGFRGCELGENLARELTEPESVVAEWLLSPDHCTNVLDPDFDVAGVGLAIATQSIWVAVLGASWQPAQP